MLIATLVLSLRGAAAVAVLVTLAGGLPRIVQLGLSVAFGVWSALLVTGSHVGTPLAISGDFALVAIAARELAIGASIGIVAAMPLLVAATAGRFVDGLGETRGSYAALFGVLGAAVFVAIDGPASTLGALLDSHRDVPALGQGLADVPVRTLDAIGALIGGAVRLSSPWLVTAAIVELGVGIGVRVAGRAALGLPGAVAVPAALVMITATLVTTLVVAIAAVIRGAG